MKLGDHIFQVNREDRSNLTSDTHDFKLWTVVAQAKLPDGLFQTVISPARCTTKQISVGGSLNKEKAYKVSFGISIIHEENSGLVVLNRDTAGGGFYLCKANASTELKDLAEGCLEEANKRIDELLEYRAKLQDIVN